MDKPYRILDWDTNFFKFRVAELKKNLLSEIDNEQEVLKSMARDGVKLAYYNSQEKLDLNFSSEFDINLVINRIPLEKKLVNEFSFQENVSFYNEDYPDKSLIELAQLAGRQGRFGLDPRVPDETCDEIFKHYIINSVNKKMAKYTLVYRENSEIIGFVTLDIKEGKGYTPLFAVKRKFEGKGVSFALMRAGETVLKKEGCKVVIGGTQKLNEKALKVYARFGVMPQKPEFIYHLWNKKI